jgi:hypothetical protein
MQRSLERFELSPEEFFAQIDRSFADLRGSVAALASRVDALAALGEELARTRLPAAAAAPPAARWTWDVRLPNYLFDDLFEHEAVAGGAKRWVGAGGRISATLVLPRHVQYDLVVHIEDFVSDAAAQSFWLRIDDVQYPWLSHEEKRYTSLVLADTARDVLHFEIGVDPASIPADRDVSFSFRMIDVVRRQ